MRLLLLAAVCVTVAHAADRSLLTNLRAPYQIGLWGDLPYSDMQATVGVPNLIKDMNAYSLRFSAFNGDWKAGSGNSSSTTPSKCSNELYAQCLGYLNSLKAPAMYTPGDNEWTDCDREKNGNYSSRERLDYIRKTFFAADKSLGKRQLSQVVQSEALCIDESGAPTACSENRRWEVNGVTYFTMNVPGSCNNLCDTSPDEPEFKARNAANIKWMKDSFAAAAKADSAAIMIISQADPGWDDSDKTRAPMRDAKNLTQIDSDPDGYFEYLTALREQVIAFKKPVAYVHGDSHYFRVDKPFLDSKGARLVNFTRVQTPGSNANNGNNDVNWVKVIVNPTSREVFNYAMMVVPGNN
ncbi:hypothetical protein OEZ86_010322 [Tetradesmus obliquus]|nr:hypothetical protein OEZ86_010322 [Tetradesmus obliquus]